MVESGVEAAVLCPVEGAMQVLSSVIQNARWAVRDGGTVTVSWSPTPAGVALVVSDDGVGIAEKLLARIGEPFVTTKAPGEGMGLGSSSRGRSPSDAAGRSISSRSRA